MVTYPALG